MQTISRHDQQTTWPVAVRSGVIHLSQLLQFCRPPWRQASAYDQVPRLADRLALRGSAVYLPAGHQTALGDSLDACTEQVLAAASVSAHRVRSAAGVIADIFAFC